MLLKPKIKWIHLVLFCNLLLISSADAYVLTGISNFSLGNASIPFSTITSTDTTVCVSAELSDSTNYSVSANSSNGGTSAFLLINSTNSSYTLAYSLSWASPTTFVALSPSSAVSFANAHNVLAPCPGSSVNAQLRLQILAANLQLAKQGSYTDTLTIIISA